MFVATEISQRAAHGSVTKLAQILQRLACELNTGAQKETIAQG